MRLEIGEKVDHLQALVEEKFSGTYAQLSQRDILAKELALATKTAVDAALQAAEKAVGKQNESNAEAIKKSEVGMIKQIDQIGEQNRATTKAFDDKLVQQLALMQAQQVAINDKFTGVKDLISSSTASTKDLISALDRRMSTADERVIGGDRADKRAGDNWGLIFGGISVAAVIGGLIVAVITLVLRVR
jgi:hypothetical protein